MKTKTKNIRSQMRLEAEDQRPSLIDSMEVANHHYHLARTHLSSALNNARICGEALINAKARMKSEAKCRWTVWLKGHFEGSLETARGFMRIASHWNNPAVVAALNSKDVPKTYTAILKVIREDKKPKPLVPQLYQAHDFEFQHSRKVLSDALRDRIKTLTHNEIDGLMKTGVDTCWEKFLEEAKRIRMLNRKGEWPPAEEPDHESIEGARIARERRNKSRRRRGNSQRSREYSY